MLSSLRNACPRPMIRNIYINIICIILHKIRGSVQGNGRFVSLKKE